MIIAIDGPAAAGKGTLARRLADHFGYAHLDTGRLYRAVAAMVLAAGHDPHDVAAAERAAKAVSHADLDRDDLRGERVAAAASIAATLPEVRAALIDFQRDFARHPPEGAPGAVLDGRDIGTVVCPEADVKLFVTASSEERARRRHQELRERGQASIYARVLEDMRVRDVRDSERASAPLKPAEDAFVLDTSDLDADAAFEAALAFVISRVGERDAKQVDG